MTYRCRTCSVGCKLDMDKVPYKDYCGREMVKIKCPFDLITYNLDTDEKIKLNPIWEKVPISDDVVYSKWCESLMDEIEAIAREKYPNIKYWIDTGSRWNACMAMLWQFKDDLKVRK